MEFFFKKLTQGKVEVSTNLKPNEVAKRFFSTDVPARILEYSKSSVICIQRHFQEAYGYEVTVPPGENPIAVLHEDAAIEYHRGFFDNCLREKGYRRNDLTDLWCLPDDTVSVLAYAHSIWEAFADKTYERGITGKQLLANWKKWQCKTPNGCYIPCSPWEAEMNLLNKN